MSSRLFQVAVLSGTKSVETMGFSPIQKVLAVFISLLAVAISFRYFVHYWGLLQRDAERLSQNLKRYRAASILLMAASLIFLVSLFTLVIDAQTGTEKIVLPFGTRTPDTALTPPEPTGPSPIPLQPATPTPESQLTLTPTLITQLARIGNTNTFGVNVRSSPSLQGEVIANLPDDTQVFLLPESLEADGFMWRHIRFFNDLEGWVANNYLIAEQ